MDGRLERTRYEGPSEPIYVLIHETQQLDAPWTRQERVTDDLNSLQDTFS